MKSNQQQNILWWRIALISIGILISWFMIFDFFVPGLILWSGILIYLIFKKSKVTWYLVLSGFVLVSIINFSTATFAYFTGGAEIKSVGGPEIYHGVDRATRAPEISSGCTPLGYEFFAFEVNNTIIAFWTTLLGYQRGAYDGYFPSSEEAKALVVAGDTISVSSGDGKIRFETKMQSVQLDEASIPGYYFGIVSHSTKVKGVAKDGCFIFQPLDFENGRNTTCVFLVDVASEKMLTCFY
jgi:hypothetical protein